MKKTMIVLVSFLVLCQATGFAAQQSDKAGCKDHPLFPTRMPDYVIESCKIEDFGAYDFQSKKGPKNRVEGKFTFITYAFTGKRDNEPSGLAVVRNYENAIQKVGGTIVQSDPERWANGTIVKDGQETWFEVHKGNGKIWLRIVEKQAMAQAIVADATVFSNEIRATGHTAVYGIYFDTGKVDHQTRVGAGHRRDRQTSQGRSRSQDLSSWAIPTIRAVSKAISSSPKTGARPFSRRWSVITALPPPACDPLGAASFHLLHPTTPRMAGPRIAGSNWSSSKPGAGSGR